MLPTTCHKRGGHHVKYYTHCNSYAVDRMLLGLTIDRYLDRRKGRITAPIRILVISQGMDWVRDKWCDRQLRNYWKALDKLNDGYWQTHDSITLKQCDPELANKIGRQDEPVLSFY